MMNDSSEFIKNYAFLEMTLKALLAFSAEDFLNLRVWLRLWMKHFANGIEKGMEEEAILEI